ncbi:MAG TPA: hypothetical protein VMU92_04785 [Acidobacteriaceae bacterium]|nr:hypothetical protein [Acidobacteriaceae bacterium]
MLFCRKKLNPLQRRFATLFFVTLIATALLFMLEVSFNVGHLGFSPHTSPLALCYVFSLLPVIPFLAMMLLIPRYLRQEKDEFVRTLVLRALLLGFAVPMVVDTVVGFAWKAAPFADAMPMFNVDLFCITALFVLAFQVRRYQ